MSAKHLATFVAVYATGIVLEVFIHGECSLDWAVVHDGILDA
jgi:hypothetical protein